MQRVALRCESYASHWMARDLGNDLLRRIALNGKSPKYGLHRFGRQKIDPDARVKHKARGRSRIKHATRRPLRPRTAPERPSAPTDPRLASRTAVLPKATHGPGQ